MTDLLVIGATGLFGQAFLAEASVRGLNVAGTARRGADIELDIDDDDALQKVIGDIRPRMIVNAAAMIDVGKCEDRPQDAWRTNARAPGRIAEFGSRRGARTIQISTDHYFTGDGDRRHSETADVVLLNEYARTKYAGEAMVLACRDTMVVRTNILGFRGWKQPTFVEWAVAAIKEDQAVTLFADSYISAIDVGSAAAAILDLAEKRATGIVNVGCREVYSKKDFVERLAARLGRTMTHAETGSVSGLAVTRAESLGLDVGLAERLLGRQLPDVDAVLDALMHSGGERHAI